MNKKAYLAILTLAATASQLLYADNDVYDNTTVTENFINASLVDSSWYKTTHCFGSEVYGIKSHQCKLQLRNA